MPDFTKSQIYKIVSANHDKVYYGSTTKTLAVRFANHKGKKNCSSRLIIAAGGAQIKHVEWFPCSGKHALEDREAQFIQDDWDGCVNKYVPGAFRRAGGKKAYMQMRSALPAVKAKQKLYHQSEKHQAHCHTPEYIAQKKAYDQTPVLCACGTWSRKGDIRRHQRTKKCKRLIESQVATVVLATPF